MTNIVTFDSSRTTDSDSAFDFRSLRKELGLTRTQAAIAMGTSPATIENWERGDSPGPNEVTATNALQTFLRENGDDAGIGKNLLFGHYPLRLARELLEIPVEEIAKRYGYKKSAWQSFEGNRRPLKPGVLEKIEEDVRQYFGELCKL